MRYKTALLAGASVLAMTVCAHADPIFTPLTFALSSAAPVWIAPGAIYAGLQLATVGALSLAGRAVFGQDRPAADPQKTKNTTAGTEGPGRYATGRVRLQGKIAFGNTAGYDIFHLLLHCFGPMDAVEEYFYDGRSLTVDPDGTVTSPPWAKSSGSNMFIHTKVGDGSETVWPQLRNNFPSVIDDDFRARGLAQTLLHVVNPGFRTESENERFQTLLQGGVKELEVLARVGQFYDPRDGGTRWSLNGVLQNLHWFRRLPNMRDDLIDFDALKPVANEADQQVPTLTGTAPRSTISGGWEGAISTDIVQDMLESAGLEVIRTAGNKYTFRFIEDDPESELTLLDRHIIDREFAPEAAKRPNICRVSYFSHERQGELAEIDLAGAAWAKAQGDIDKYGDKEKHFQLPFCDNSSQAQRIVRRLFWMERATRGIIRTTFAGVAAWGKRTITVEVPDVGEGGESAFVKCRIIAPVRFNWAEGRCEIPVAIIPDELKTPWNAATMEQPAPPVLPDFQYESDLPQPARPSAASVVQYSGGAWETRVKFTGVSGGTTAEANYRTYSGGLPEQWAGMTEYKSDVGSFYIGYVAENTNGDHVDFRSRFADSDGNVSYFSDTLSVDPLDVDNTAPPEPNLDVETTGTPGPNTITYDITASTTGMNAARLVIKFNGADLAESNGRPGQELVAQDTVGQGTAVTIEVIAYTTDGTASPVATYSSN